MSRRVAVTGARGQLGSQLVYAFGRAGDEVLPLARPEFDITLQPDLDRLVEWRPEMVVNAAAWTDVDACARDPELALRINGEAAGSVAGAAARVGALVVQVSTNEVFEGSLHRPYDERDRPSPINPYGASKLLGERLVAAANRRHLIVRTSWLFGPGSQNFVTKIIGAAAQSLSAGEPLRVVRDEWGNPTWAPGLAEAIVSVAAENYPGDQGMRIRHLSGLPSTTRFDWAQLIMDAARIPVKLETAAQLDFVRASTPPPRAILETTDEHAKTLPHVDWRSATVDYVRQMSVQP